MTRSRAALALGFVGAAAASGGVAVADHPATWVIAAGLLGGTLGLYAVSSTAAWLVAAVILAGTPLAEGGPMPDEVYVLAFAHPFMAGRSDRSRVAIAGLAALTAASVACAGLTGSEMVPATFIPIAAWGAGRALGDREAVAAELALRGRELDSEREAHAALSVRYERARIASELHDIVAHAISVMVVQASAGQRLAASDPDATAETFQNIAGAARQAEQDLGRLVALLGDEDAIGPAPDLALIDELVSRAAGSGLDVTLRLEGEREGMPAELVAIAYRVVQEGLTNALRYASGAPVSVSVTGGRRELVVEVANGPAAEAPTLYGNGTGNGLRGLRERVSACGGSLQAGTPADDRGWLLTARLPRQVPVTSAPS